MNINRHNYEEFFILYMDNELSSEDRRMVEHFVESHPDLKEELELLMQYKLVPDELIVFENKEALIKGSAIINVANYEEWLLSYVDDELITEQKIAVEKFVANNPLATKELSLLQKSKLQPEAIVFDNKELLYRKEEKVRRIPVGWWRAAAAVLIVALGLTTFLLLNKKSSTEVGPVTKTPGTEQKSPVQTTIGQPGNETIVADVNDQQKDDITDREENNATQQAKAPIKKENEKNLAVTNAVVSPKNSPVNKNITTPAKNEPVLTANTPINNNLPLPTYNPNVIKDDATNNAMANLNVPKETKKVDALTNPDVTTKSTQPSDPYISAASIKNITEIEEESQQDDKKNKLRGFFRKVTRTFEKRTNIEATNDDGKLLVAGLAIKLK